MTRQNVCNGSKVRRVAELNDQLRTRLEGGKVMMTSGFAALEAGIKAQLMQAVMTFADFNTDNDPHGERDFCSVEVEGVKAFWKVDYYDTDIRYGSDDPSDASKTTRIATYMLAEEY
jgi:ABC-type branched-subunit amino acid transport system substrate-binding protein